MILLIIATENNWVQDNHQNIANMKEIKFDSLEASQKMRSHVQVFDWGVEGAENGTGKGQAMMAPMQCLQRGRCQLNSTEEYWRDPHPGQELSGTGSVLSGKKQ